MKRLLQKKRSKAYLIGDIEAEDSCDQHEDSTDDHEKGCQQKVHRHHFKVVQPVESHQPWPHTHQD